MASLMKVLASVTRVCREERAATAHSTHTKRAHSASRRRLCCLRPSAQNRSVARSLSPLLEAGGEAPTGGGGVAATVELASTLSERCLADSTMAAEAAAAAVIAGAAASGRGAVGGGGCRIASACEKSSLCEIRFLSPRATPSEEAWALVSPSELELQLCASSLALTSGVRRPDGCITLNCFSTHASCDQRGSTRNFSGVAGSGDAVLVVAESVVDGSGLDSSSLPCLRLGVVMLSLCDRR